jgi:transcriptional regulator with XRE-family HTH domain
MRTTGHSLALAMALEHREQGRRIAELREQRGLSQEEAARLVGVSNSGYQKWELGGGIRGANLRRLAEVLETTIDEIRGRDAEPVNPFSVMQEIDDRVQEYRQFSYEMRDAFAEVADKLDRQYAMLQQIFSKLATPEAAAELLEGAELLETLAQRRAADRAASSAAPADTRRRRAG